MRVLRNKLHRVKRERLQRWAVARRFPMSWKFDSGL